MIQEKNLMEKLVFENKEEMENNLGMLLKRKMGEGVFISKIVKIEDNLFNYIISADSLRIIDDSKNNKRFIKFLRFDSIGLLEIKKENSKYEVVLPLREEIANKIVSKFSTLIFATENALLETAHEKLVEIPIVQTSLNPIKEILLNIHKIGSIDISEFIKSRGERRALVYINFLENLEFVRRENGNCMAGNRMIELEKILSKEDDKNLYNKVLASVLQHGHRNIFEYLKLTSLIPFIRWSTAYFLPSVQVKKILYLNEKALNLNYEKLYNVNVARNQIKTRNQINQIINAGILNKEDSLVYGDRNIFDSISTSIRF